MSDPVKWAPVLHQFSMITRPYPKVNGLKTIPFPAAYTHIANVWEYPPPGTGKGFRGASGTYPLNFMESSPPAGDKTHKVNWEPSVLHSPLEMLLHSFFTVPSLSTLTKVCFQLVEPKIKGNFLWQLYPVHFHLLWAPHLQTASEP